MFREIFSEEEGNHHEMSEQCGQEYGNGRVHGMFMRWQENDDGNIRGFMEL